MDEYDGLAVTSTQGDYLLSQLRYHIKAEHRVVIKERNTKSFSNISFVHPHCDPNYLFLIVIIPMLSSFATILKPLRHAECGMR